VLVEEEETDSINFQIAVANPEWQNKHEEITLQKSLKGKKITPQQGNRRSERINKAPNKKQNDNSSLEC